MYKYFSFWILLSHDNCYLASYIYGGIFKTDVKYIGDLMSIEIEKFKCQGIFMALSWYWNYSTTHRTEIVCWRVIPGRQDVGNVRRKRF